MIQNDSKKEGKIYECLKCDYIARDKTNYYRHIDTQNIIML